MIEEVLLLPKEEIVNTIMLVEVDNDISNSQLDLFQDLGYEVVKFSNAASALRQYKKYFETVNFVVLSVKSIVKSGQVFINSIKEVNTDIKLVFISNDKSSEETVISAPFTFEELSSTLAKIA